MPEYRLYCLDWNGNFTSIEEIAALNDAEAIILAKRLKRAVNSELRECSRMVAKIPAAVALTPSRAVLFGDRNHVRGHNGHNQL